MTVSAPAQSERVPDLLDHTCRRILSAIDQSPLASGDPHALAPALGELSHALRSVRAGDAMPSFGASPWTAVARPLLDAIRRQLLLAANHAGDAEAFKESHAWLMAIEQVHDALLSDSLYNAAAQLGGVHALEMLVNVAHDMRSPLGAILLLVERVRSGHSGSVNEAQCRQLGLAYSAAFALSTMVSDLMELARGSGRLVGAEPVPFSLADVLRQVDELVRPVAEEKGLALTVAPVPRETRMGHPAALTRVLLHLATNACKFTQDGLVRLEVRFAAVDQVEFHVSDTGRGVPEHLTQGVYSAFRVRGGSGAAETDLTFSSEGLGLAICRKLVRAMGGELMIAAGENGGTLVQFALRLPMHDQSAANRR